jgi:hypothetical protein
MICAGIHLFVDFYTIVIIKDMNVRDTQDRIKLTIQAHLALGKTS